ncbi:hypothetical protein [Flavihumibacter petaseus]|uniref:Uncharacterized protein n=1 Tax=Flavihumibacter petaseus NBRC 106054 TaxID=1220578 RepID=A0A0E9N3C3_9BACT|nr:hypothetical protein [Flavihumibacter petaseus]GAO44171.1 hypothetical protein FPE01S_03_02090 [Flavihumibacter petaseus NBRC 106054]
MKKVAITTTLVTLYLVFFQLTPFIGFSPAAISWMFIASPFLIIGMVYVILKYGKPSRYTFDERFYDDLDYERNGKE